MKTVTVRDPRRRWLETEKALESEGAVLITRDSKPIARLVRISAVPGDRPRFDPIEHLTWQRRVSRGVTRCWSTSLGARERSDRELRRRP